jgi:hypothetical protein
MNENLNLRHRLELSVHVRPEDAAAAEAKGYKGARTDINYPAIPRVGEFFTVHMAVEPLEVTKVMHWGPGFGEQWTEIHFYASVNAVEKILASTKDEVDERWESEEL